MNNIFVLRRFLSMSRVELELKARSTGIAAAAVAGVLLIISLASVWGGSLWDMHSVFYPLTLLAGGLIATSLSFGELNDKRSGIQFLTLPASQFEKYISKLLITSIGWIILATAGYFVFSLLSAGLSQLFFRRSMAIFNPFQRDYLWFWSLYLLCHATVFFGAVYFRKNSLFKTVLSIVIIAFASALFMLITVRIVFLDQFVGLTLQIAEGSSIFKAPPDSEYLTTLANIQDFITTWILPPYFWILGFLRLRETEV